MMTRNEARQRAEIHNGSIRPIYGTAPIEYLVSLNEWDANERREQSLRTDDLEDAVIKLGNLRHSVNKGQRNAR